MFQLSHLRIEKKKKLSDTGARGWGKTRMREARWRRPIEGKTHMVIYLLQNFYDYVLHETIEGNES